MTITSTSSFFTPWTLNLLHCNIKSLLTQPRLSLLTNIFNSCLIVTVNEVFFNSIIVTGSYYTSLHNIRVWAIPGLSYISLSFSPYPLSHITNRFFSELLLLSRYMVTTHHILLLKLLKFWTQFLDNSHIML